MLLVPVSYDWIKIEIIALMQIVLRVLAFIWASPYSLLGLLLGVIGLCTGGRARIRGRTIEFHGGAVKWFVAHLPQGLSHSPLRSVTRSSASRTLRSITRVTMKWCTFGNSNDGGRSWGPPIFLRRSAFGLPGGIRIEITLLNEKRIGRVEVNEHRTMSTGR